MISFLKEWVFNLAAMGIFLILIDILAPAGKSKKVISLVSGFILILTIIQPFFNWFRSNINFGEIYDQNNNYIEAIMATAETSGANSAQSFSAIELKERQNKQIINIYSQKLADNIRKIVMEVENFQKVDVDLIINEDYSSWNYGEIKKIYINAYLYKMRSEDEGGKSKISINIDRIEEVKIEPINNIGNSSEYSSNLKDEYNKQTNYDNLENDNHKNMEELAKKIKEKVSLSTGVMKENIVVSVLS